MRFYLHTLALESFIHFTSLSRTADISVNRIQRDQSYDRATSLVSYEAKGVRERCKLLNRSVQHEQTIPSIVDNRVEIVRRNVLIEITKISYRTIREHLVEASIPTTVWRYRILPTVP